MAYLPLPADAPGAAGSPAAEDAVLALLRDLAARKEFRAPAFDTRGEAPPLDGFQLSPPALQLPGLRLSGAQRFLQAFASPDTPYPRQVVCWHPGLGKSIGMLAPAMEHLRRFRAQAALGATRGRAPSVVVLSFAGRETIVEELLRHPEFGFVSADEVAALRRLRAAEEVGGPSAPEARQRAGLLGALRRRLTDRAQGGLFRFYGYKEFANRLFAVTARGATQGFDLQALYAADADFSDRVAEAQRRDLLAVNRELLAELEDGFLACDEIHNVYNILAPNNYGLAIQFALDSLGPRAPRLLAMSATVATGSAAEVVDLLNLLVPRAQRPGGRLFRREDFFSRSSRRAPAEGAPGAEKTSGETKVARSEGPQRPDEAAPPEGGPETPEPRAAPERDADDSEFVVSQLREGALERIAHLSAGRVSFLLDADVDLYPSREFVGSEVPGVPYLRFVLCPMSPFHERTLALASSRAGGLAPEAFALYDLAFPNPAFAPDAAQNDPAAVGLFRSGEVQSALGRAEPAWRAAAGVVVVPGAPSEGPLISGAFLAPERIATYSAKYARIGLEAVAALRAGPGKILIYHHRVRTSGVLLLQEVLRMHGFVDGDSPATEQTLCSVCGETARAHRSSQPRGAEGPAGKPEAPAGKPEAPAGKPEAPAGKPEAPAAWPPPHSFEPARFLVAHSDLDSASRQRALARFNAPENLEGRRVRALVGSRVIGESLNFVALRDIFVASLPVDYPSLIQLLGRGRRKGSHLALPPSQRSVRLRVFASAHADGRLSPELLRYASKGREFLVIQQVERALRAYAVDAFANFGRIEAALGAAPSLDGLPYAPAVPGKPPAPLAVESFEAYGFGAREVDTLAAVCGALFRARPVWTYEDLWAAVRGGAVRGAAYDPALFDEGNFALALEGLERPWGEPPWALARAGRFLVAAPWALADARPALDVGCYLRSGAGLPRPRVRLADLPRPQAPRGFAERLAAFDAAYLAEPGVVELSLLECGSAFHVGLLRRLISGVRSEAAPGAPVTRDDARVAALYRRFKLAVTVAEAGAAGGPAFRGAAGRPADALAGYLGSDSVHLFDPRAPGGGAWLEAPLAAFGVGPRRNENDTVVGFVADAGPGAAGGKAGPGPGGGAVLKLRPPLQRLQARLAGLSAGTAGEKNAGVRALERGAVCATRQRPELADLVRRLRSALAAALRAGPADPLVPAYVARLDRGEGRAPQERDGKSAGPSPERQSSAQLCRALAGLLLALEELARRAPDGMIRGTRWLYLYADRPPSIAALRPPRAA